MLDSISHIGPLTNNPSEAKRLQVIRPNQGTPLIQTLTSINNKHQKTDDAIKTSNSAKSRKNDNKNRRRKQKKQKPDDLNWRGNRRMTKDDRLAMRTEHYQSNVEDTANRMNGRNKVS